MAYEVKGKHSVVIDGQRFAPGIHDNPLLEKGIALFPKLVERVSGAAPKPSATDTDTKPLEDEKPSESARGKGK